MLNLVLDPDKPASEQIAEHVHLGVALGVIPVPVLREGDELPGVQQWAKTLGISPTTAAKALKILREDGTVSTSPGERTVIREGADTRPMIFRRAFRWALLVARAMHMNKDDVSAVVTAEIDRQYRRARPIR